MPTQVRVYRMKPGELAVFVDEWLRQVVPLRRRFGFKIEHAWASEGDDTPAVSNAMTNVSTASFIKNYLRSVICRYSVT